MSVLRPSTPAIAAMAFLFELFCARKGHKHPVTEAWICAEAILARVPGSTGLATIRPIQASPGLIAYNERCILAGHVHGAVGAGPCLDRHFRGEREDNIEQLNRLLQRAAAAARPSNDVSSSTRRTATNSLDGWEQYGYGTAGAATDASKAPKEA